MQYIQIDEPAVSTRFEDVALANEAMGRITKGLHAKTIKHICHGDCYGDFAPQYDELVKMPVAQFDLEMPNSGYDLIEVMRKKGFHKIGLGVLDVHAHKVESVEEVVKRIKLALEFLPPEKIYVDPDCGLKTSTWERLRPRSRS